MDSKPEPGLEMQRGTGRPKPQTVTGLASRASSGVASINPVQFRAPREHTPGLSVLPDLPGFWQGFRGVPSNLRAGERPALGPAGKERSVGRCQ